MLASNLRLARSVSYIPCYDPTLPFVKKLAKNKKPASNPQDDDVLAKFDVIKDDFISDSRNHYPQCRQKGGYTIDQATYDGATMTLLAENIQNWCIDNKVEVPPTGEK